MRVPFDKCKAFTLEIFVGTILVVVFLQFRFVIKKFLLRG